MKRSKKIFLIISIIFIIGLLFIGYDISKKTSFPGSESVLEDTLISENPDDSVNTQKTNKAVDDLNKKVEEEEN